MLGVGRVCIVSLAPALQSESTRRHQKGDARLRVLSPTGKCSVRNVMLEGGALSTQQSYTINRP